MSDLPKATPDNAQAPTLTQIADPPSVNYVELIHFLMGPFLDSPKSLRVNCETSHQNTRVLIRLAIEGEDKGKIFGRGGRNIQAVRTVLQGIARTVEQKVHLEVFGGEGERAAGEHTSTGKAKPKRPSPKRPSRRPPRSSSTPSS